METKKNFLQETLKALGVKTIDEAEKIIEWFRIYQRSEIGQRQIKLSSKWCVSNEELELMAKNPSISIYSHENMDYALLLLDVDYQDSKDNTYYPNPTFEGTILLKDDTWLVRERDNEEGWKWVHYNGKYYSKDCLLVVKES